MMRSILCTRPLFLVVCFSLQACTQCGNPNTAEDAGTPPNTTDGGQSSGGVAGSSSVSTASSRLSSSSALPGSSSSSAASASSTPASSNGASGSSSGATSVDPPATSTVTSGTTGGSSATPSSSASGGTSGTASSQDTSSGGSMGSGSSAGATSMVCAPLSTRSCYTGDPLTLGVGICAAGTETCTAAGDGYGPCAGEIQPATETCNTPEDDDCNGQTNESGAGCVCAPLAVQSCYSGAPGTANVGVCIPGMATCNDQGTMLGSCLGEVVPVTEACTTPQDEDCDGLTPPCPGLWGVQGGAGADHFVWAASADANGRVAVVGQFTGTVTLGGITLNSAGASDALVAVFEADGSVAWALALGNNLPQAAQAVAFEPNGDVVVAGWFQGTITLGANLATSGGADIFLARLNGATGATVWGQKFGSATDEQLGLAVATQANGDVVVAGGFAGTVNFGGGSLSSAGAADVFVASYAGATGAHQWSRRYGDALPQTALAVATATNGNVTFAGRFAGAVDFGAGAVTSAGDEDAMVVTLDATGNHVWSRRLGDLGTQQVHAVAVDADGHVLVAGEFEGALGVGAATSAGSSDAFVARLDGSTGADLGVFSFGGRRHDAAYALSVRNGVVAVTGHVHGRATVGSTSITAGERDGLLVRLDAATLTPNWTRLLGDGATQSGRAIALTSTNQVVVGGYFSGVLDLGAFALNGPFPAVDLFVVNAGP